MADTYKNTIPESSVRMTKPADGRMSRDKYKNDPRMAQNALSKTEYGKSREACERRSEAIERKQKVQKY